MMVAGQVTPPRLDLANEDLVRAHVHASGCSETGMSLGVSLKDLLDVEGDDPSLALLPSVRRPTSIARTRACAPRIARGACSPSLTAELETAPWWTATWLDDVLPPDRRRASRTPASVGGASFAPPAHSSTRRTKIIADAGRVAAGQRASAEAAPRSRGAARAADRRSAQRVTQSDFYSYRYFASEGFLPGYSFPRLPLSAFIPGRRGQPKAARSSCRAPGSWRSASSARRTSSITKDRATRSIA